MKTLLCGVLAGLAMATASASPTGQTGELGERMARAALGGAALEFVDVQRGRHGMDLVYYDDQGRLNVAEVKVGGSQQARELSLDAEERALLKREGIAAEALGDGRYRIVQGAHGYNLVQSQRTLERQARIDRLFDAWRANQPLSNREAAELADYLGTLDVPLAPADRHLLQRAAAHQEAPTILRALRQRQGEDWHAAHRRHGQSLQRIAKEIHARRYHNQLIRVESQGGRFAIASTALDGNGKPTGAPREIENIDWASLRASGPFRRLIKDEARGVCSSDRVCTERAYQATLAQLEQGRTLHQAMQHMSHAAQTGALPPMPRMDASPPPSARTVAPALRKTPLLARLRRFMGTGTTSAINALVLPTMIASAPVAAMSALLTIGGGLVFDALLNTALGGEANAQGQPALHLETLQRDLSALGGQVDQGFASVNRHIADWGQYQVQYLQAIQQDLSALGERVEYGFALTLETLDRHSQRIDARLDTIDSRLATGFADLSQALLVAELKQDRGLALQEAQFNDALQAGMKHYDAYLVTGARDSLVEADAELTRAQARYENLIDAQGAQATRAEWLQHALASYYRALVYAERASVEPPFAQQALATFVAFLDRLGDPRRLEEVLPIVNETYVALADIDREGAGGARLAQAYTVLIQHHLVHARHDQARAYAHLLTLARDDDTTRGLNALVRYLTGEAGELSELAWRLEDDWRDWIAQRAHPRPGTIFALIDCAERAERGLTSAPDACRLSPEALVKAANAYENEAIRRYVVTELLGANRLAEARDILDHHYIADSVFRLRHQLSIAYFLKDERGESGRYCRLSQHILADETFPATLREKVREHRAQWGGFCDGRS